MVEIKLWCVLSHNLILRPAWISQTGSHIIYPRRRDLENGLLFYIILYYIFIIVFHLEQWRDLENGLYYFTLYYIISYYSFSPGTMKRFRKWIILFYTILYYFFIIVFHLEQWRDLENGLYYFTLYYIFLIIVFTWNNEVEHVVNSSLQNM